MQINFMRKIAGDKSLPIGESMKRDETHACGITLVYRVFGNSIVGEAFVHSNPGINAAVNVLISAVSSCRHELRRGHALDRNNIVGSRPGIT